jgi:superfamily II DNA helicase RecQ
MDDADKFDLSLEDEAALAAACDKIDASNNSSKRKHAAKNDDIEPPAKKQISNSYPTKSLLGVKVLNEQFGLDQFRLEQEEVISRILEGGSAVVVFPTGSGKSLCYQVSSSLQYPEEYREYDAAS